MLRSVSQQAIGNNVAASGLVGRKLKLRSFVRTVSSKIRPKKKVL